MAVDREAGHTGVMVVEAGLVAAVDAASERTGRGLAPWPDPHPDRSPLDEEYSRLSDPGRWRIIGARADAWLVAIVNAGLAVVERNASVRWRLQPGPAISRTERVVPFADGALPLVVARSQLGHIDDAGVVLGVGTPPICLRWLPECGCDACDSGSQDELDLLDEHVCSVISGAFRRLSSGDREITVLSDGRWSASGAFGRQEIDAIIIDPVGWDEVSGEPWLPVAERT